VVVTDHSLTVEFVYEAVIASSVDVDSVVSSMDTTTARLVGSDMMDCEVLRRKLQAVTTVENASGGRPQVEGVDPSPQDSVTGNACTYFTTQDGNLPSDADCHVIHGLMTLYFNEEPTEESSRMAQQALEASFNEDDPSPFLASSGSNYGVKDVEAVRYMYEGAPVVEPLAPDKAIEGNYEDKSLSSGWIGGISMIAIGAVAILALALVFLRKRQRDIQQESYSMFDEDELKNEEDDSQNETKDWTVMIDDETIGKDWDMNIDDLEIEIDHENISSSS
jgi:hypothetical protein